MIASNKHNVMMEFTGRLIYQGAESRVYESLYIDRPVIIKERLSKSYRVKELDKKINKHRLQQEIKCMVKCRRAGVATPSIYLIDSENNRLYLEKIMGLTLKDILWSQPSSSDFCTTNEIVLEDEQLVAIAKSVGTIIGKMHDAEIVHGDLTTSNIMVRNEGTSSSLPGVDAVLIDFGLGMMKPSMDDKAVDLYVLERAFASTHPNSEHLVQSILESYRFSSRKGTATLMKLEQVRLRGRKRDMTG